MVEQSTVNRKAIGSNPIEGAKMEGIRPDEDPILKIGGCYSLQSSSLWPSAIFACLLKVGNPALTRII